MQVALLDQGEQDLLGAADEAVRDRCGTAFRQSCTRTVLLSAPTGRVAEAMDVDNEPVSSRWVGGGFHGGIRDVRTVEERMNAHDQSIEVAEKNCLSIGKYSEREKSGDGRWTEGELWLQHLPDEAPGA